MIEQTFTHSFQSFVRQLRNPAAIISRRRLDSLEEQWRAQKEVREEVVLDWSNAESNLALISGRLGRAGYLASADKRKAKLLITCFILGVTFLAVALGSRSGSTYAVVSGVLALYTSFLISLYYLRHREAEVRREVMFQLPLVLENLILMVEAGLGVLPALEQIVFSRIHSAREQGRALDLTTFLLKVVYDLSAHGMPFAEALERVADATEIRSLRHVLLHLDISASEGGELIPSMRSLSDHAHTEWRLSVETRVNRLENMVVFPVFTSVIGLMILTASVPLVPVLEFFESVKMQNQTQSGATLSRVSEPVPSLRKR